MSSLLGLLEQSLEASAATCLVERFCLGDVTLLGERIGFHRSHGRHRDTSCRGGVDHHVPGSDVTACAACCVRVVATEGAAGDIGMVVADVGGGIGGGRHVGDRHADA